MNRTKKTSLGLLVLIFIIFLFGFTQTACLSSFGGTPEGSRLERMKTSPMFKEGKFANNPDVPTLTPGASYWEIMKRQFFGSEVRHPPGEIPVVFPKADTFSSPLKPGLRAIWFGHATLLLEIDGLRVLVDPVFSEKVSPFTSVGPERFFPLPVKLEDLPMIDAVVISHDHYDHLDMTVAKTLSKKGTKYYVPLGIGAHLEKWGVPQSQIIEMEWWEKAKLGEVEIICTPAVHYSGRGLFNRFTTLWSSWSLVGPKHRFFYTGDTGYSPHFAEIGKQLGPFDLTSIKVGAYDWTWEGIHMNAEKAISAHLDVKGKRMLPVHWGTFNLANHDWDEPIKIAQKGAIQNGIDLLTPKPGELIDADLPFTSTNWWENLKKKD